VSHHLGDIGRIRHRLGAGAPHQVGVVSQLSTSRGGVPKLPVDEVVVDWSGVVGDRQAARQHHGRPWQALCLWSDEVIAGLRAEGHPIHAGAAGENVTVAGLDWPSLRPGTRFRVGEVLAEISSYAIPCQKNAQWFSDGVFDRMHHERHPGWSRLYAGVLRPGRIAVGDQVVVEPDGDT
jgi:MOSC domain-containing protein YiiM